MKWVKRFAAGALAAALSLALLCGCSGSSIDEGTVIDYEESVTSYMTMESWIMGSPVVYECTNVSSGVKLYVETVGTRYYVGTNQAGVMNIARVNEYDSTGKDRNNQTVAVGIYSIDRVNKTYRKMASWIRWKECWAKSCIAAAAMTTPIILSPQRARKKSGRLPASKIRKSTILKYLNMTMQRSHCTTRQRTSRVQIQTLSILRYTSRVKKLRGQNLQPREHRGATREQYIRN